eukprot:GHRQ01008544.1.p1 GENE.GHRQ01008544.1~~GHRQ01008544.1.p1  ORF type:complete len:322 (+),score=172.48 GHRQ01008544.1:488-1453(+)
MWQQPEEQQHSQHDGQGLSQGHQAGQGDAAAAVAVSGVHRTAAAGAAGAAHTARADLQVDHAEAGQLGSSSSGDFSDADAGTDEYEDEDEDEDEDGGSESGSQLSLPLTQQAWKPDYTFKVLLVGDSGVGKTCLVMRFVSDSFEDHLPATVGVDFCVERMVVHDLQIKCTIWDTAGQERFRALTSTFYRGAKGIIFVYDVTRRHTLESLSGSWMAELESYQPHPHVARMVVANKVDAHNAREVSWQEGVDFAKQHGCLFVETSAKQNIAVGVAFEELLLRILDTPELLAEAEEEQRQQASRSVNLTAPAAAGAGYAVSCSC